MRFSTKTEYGLRVLIELALLEPGASVPAKQIAASEHIPQRFLEQQVTALRKAGLVNSRRGSGGGCALARPPDRITVADAVEALEGPVVDVPVGVPDSVATRVVREIWTLAGRELRKTLADTTVAELAARKKQLEESRSPMFYI